MIIVFAFLSLSCIGQNEQKNQLSVELDPAPFILKGYSVSVKFRPKNTPRVAYMASVYQSDFPNGMMAKTNREKGWTDLKFRPSYAAFVEFYLKDKAEGLYFGPAVFLYHKSVELEVLNERITFRTIYPNMRLGYVWFPFKKIDFYINPWLNFGSEASLDQKNSLNGIQFDMYNLYYIMALHIGYRINL